MRKGFFRIVVAAAATALLSSSASAVDLSPWKPGRGDVLTVQAADAGFVLSLECSPTTGFGATLSSNEFEYRAVISSVLLKAGDRPATKVSFDQSGALPAMTRLKNMDALEKAILANGAVKMKLSAAGQDDVVATYTFGDLKRSETEILKVCPPF